MKKNAEAAAKKRKFMHYDQKKLRYLLKIIQQSKLSDSALKKTDKEYKTTI